MPRFWWREKNYLKKVFLSCEKCMSKIREGKRRLRRWRDSTWQDQSLCTYRPCAWQWALLLPAFPSFPVMDCLVKTELRDQGPCAPLLGQVTTGVVWVLHWERLHEERLDMSSCDVKSPASVSKRGLPHALSPGLWVILLWAVPCILPSLCLQPNTPGTNFLSPVVDSHSCIRPFRRRPFSHWSGTNKD